MTAYAFRQRAARTILEELIWAALVNAAQEGKTTVADLTARIAGTIEQSPHVKVIRRAGSGF